MRPFSLPWRSATVALGVTLAAPVHAQAITGAAPPVPAASAPPGWAPSAAPPPYFVAPAAPYPGYAPYPQPGPAAADQRQAAGSRPIASAWPSRAAVAAGGILSQGLDATDATTRQGGFFLGGRYVVDRRFVLSGRYAFAGGHAVERLPGARFDGTPNDVDQRQGRHAIDASFGYLAPIVEGHESVWAMPYLGPRTLLLVDAASPLWALEADLGARVGVLSGDAFEATAFLAYAPALAKASSPASLYGTIVGELRFGAGAEVRPGGPLGLTLAYEGDVVSLQHQKLTYHQLLAGLTYSFD